MSHKKIYIGMVVAIGIMGIIFSNQYRRFKEIVTHPDTVPLINSQTVDIPLDANDVALGNPGAPITIVEFSSLDCRECHDVHFKLADFVQKNSSAIRLYWKDTVLPKYFIQMNKTAGASVYCSALQNPALQFKYIETAMNDKINFNEAGINKAGEEAGLSGPVLWQCANSPDAQAKADSSMLVAQALGIKSLPTIFVNNKKINLDSDVDLEKLLNTLIK